jgi:hypothetical protein
MLIQQWGQGKDAINPVELEWYGGQTDHHQFREHIHQAELTLVCLKNEPPR